MKKKSSALNKEHESFATFRRIVKYDEMIASGKYPNVQDFMNKFEISEATVHRDLDALRYDFGAESVLEFTAGETTKLNLKVGQKLELIRC